MMNTVYELRVVKLDGSVELRQVKIEMPSPRAEPPTAINFWADRYQCMPGERVVLSWECGRACVEVYFYAQRPILATCQAGVPTVARRKAARSLRR